MRSSLASLLLAAAAWLPLAAPFATGPPMTRRRPRRSGVAALVACAAADPRHEPLLSWLEKCGSELGPVSLGKSRIGAGYGAFATRDVAEGELLFSVPEVPFALAAAGAAADLLRGTEGMELRLASSFIESEASARRHARRLQRSRLLLGVLTAPPDPFPSQTRCTGPTRPLTRSRGRAWMDQMWRTSSRLG